MKTKPYQHQLSTYEQSRDLEYYGVWWEPGLGKSKLVVDTSCHLWHRRRITGLLVVAPNGVHSNMLTQEWPVHVWDDVPWVGHVYHSGRAATKAAQRELARVMPAGAEGRLAVLVMSYDGIKTKRGFETAQAFLTQHKVMMVLDESTAIAEEKSEVSKTCCELGPLARYRRVMSGTPVAEGPFKIYAPMKFLHHEFWKAWGYGSFFVFKNAFALFKTQQAYVMDRATGQRRPGHQFQQLLRYQNIDHLQRILKEHSSRVLKEDALDLPPKVYSRVGFELEDKQRRVYDDLRQQMIAEIDADHSITAMSALVRLTRLQQLTSGYAVTAEMPPMAVGDLVMYQSDGPMMHGEVTELQDGRCVLLCSPVAQGELFSDEAHVVATATDDPRIIRLTATNQKTIELFEPRKNPRLIALLSILEPITHKVIIWARFTRDIDIICGALGASAVRYDGQVGTKDRETALARFRGDDTCRYFVANPQAISMGVTLTQAKTVIYYSNAFPLEKRLQSEDRAHRIGQDTKVSVIDMVATDTVDEHIVATLLKKFQLAATVTGDRLREWIR